MAQGHRRRSQKKRQPWSKDLGVGQRALWKFPKGRRTGGQALEFFFFFFFLLGICVCVCALACVRARVRVCAEDRT